MLGIKEDQRVKKEEPVVLGKVEKSAEKPT
jgi:hypothetical protein